MPAKGLAKALPFIRSGGGGGFAGPSTTFSVTSALRGFDFAWNESNPEWLIYASLTNDYSGAVKIATSTGQASSVATIDDSDNSPVVLGGLVTGNKYYFWLVTGDGSGNPSGTESSSETARSFASIDNGQTLAFRVPRDLGAATNAGGTSTFVQVLFGSVIPPIGVRLTYNGIAADTDGAGYWEDIVTSDDQTNQPIDYSFSVSNFSGSTFTFWNTEP
jgi:hypothetical protein